MCNKTSGTTESSGKWFQSMCSHRLWNLLPDSFIRNWDPKEKTWKRLSPDTNCAATRHHKSLEDSPIFSPCISPASESHSVAQCEPASRDASGKHQNSLVPRCERGAGIKVRHFFACYSFQKVCIFTCTWLSCHLTSELRLGARRRKL